MPEKDKAARKSWNSGIVVGQKSAFTLAETEAIEAYLLTQENWHDLALLALGTDSMLRAGDLLELQVWRVVYPNGRVRSTVAAKQQKTKRSVFPALTPKTREYLAYFVLVSGKLPDDFLFTRTKDPHTAPITRAHYADIIKGWADILGLEPSEYSTHSIRRTKPAHMYAEGEDIALISKLLGHKSIAVTIEYLGITQKKAEEASLRHPMVKGSQRVRAELKRRKFPGF